MADELVLQVERERLNILQVIGAGTHQKAVEAELFVPDEKPDIERVLSVDVKVKPCGRIRVIHDKVIIDSVLEFDTVYVADTKEEDQPIHCMEHTVHFTDFIDVKNAEDCMESDVHLEIEDVHYDEIDGCKIRVVVIVQSTAKVFEMGQMDIISDMRIVSREEANAPQKMPIEGGPLPKYSTEKHAKSMHTKHNHMMTKEGTQHVVKSGDTLSGIAHMHGVTVAEIARLNNIKDVNRIHIGQVLRIPGKGS